MDRRAERILRGAVEAERRLCDLALEREHLRDVATRAGLPMTDGPASPQRDSHIERAAVRIADLDSALEDEARRMQDVIRQAEQLIAGVPNERDRRLLRLRYMCGLSWHDIQDALGYTQIKSVYRAHRRALRAAQQSVRPGK